MTTPTHRSRASRRPSIAGAARLRRRRLAAAVIAVVVLVGAGESVIWAATRSQGQTDASAVTDVTAPQMLIPAPIFSSPPTSAPTSEPAPAAASAPEPAPVAVAPPGFDKTARSIDDPTSIWFVVDKTRPIPDAAGYVPPDLVSLRSDIPNPNGFPLRQEAADAVATMVDAATAEIGQQLIAQSGYRSYNTQVNAYRSYVSNLGTAAADLTSAKPGFSEHQTGMALDILATGTGCSLDGPCFGSTTAGEWLAANSYRFGFIVRYPADKTAVTGYEYEPWHFRYVGVDLATEMHNTGVETLEEFFGLAPAPDYLE